MINHGEFGKMVKRQDASDLAASMKVIISNEQVRLRYIDKSTERAKRFEFKEVMQEYISEYNQLIDN